ncbi:hypothetical protein AAFF_G00108250 [Aldrovandia affinis]|uniref:HMG box domain-containing protein n=1 Tax=Aldrovandia affinis TaxID=143900 RepID=A0AAD7RTT2_9TELE|nr:hypothetical protein AAFF_G00108250 [Aldrovandia affinis]
MNLDSSLNPVLTEDSMTVVSPGDVTPISLTRFDLASISSLQPGDSTRHADIVPPGGLSSEDAEEGSSAPAAFINGVPVTVSLQNVDGQQRIVCVATDARGGTVSYVGQLTSEASLEFQADVPPQPLLADDEVPPLPPGEELLSVHPQPAPLQPLETLHPCLLLEPEPDPRHQDTEEPKKRKGGWPKGKKRKPQREFSAPRAPTTGYVIFVNERKVQLKADNPDVPFTEITKMLGIQWSQLSLEEKQRYNNEAEKDKQRYIRELIAYQNTEAYRDFLRRKALNKGKDLCSTSQGVVCDEAELEDEAFALSQMDGDENNDLYCRTCNQYFSSLHNKKEHLLGKQHLLTLTEEFEKETGSQRKAAEPEEDADEEEDEEDDEDKELARLCGLSSLDLSSLEELLLRQVNLREFELQELKSNLSQERKKQEHLNAELLELQKQKVSLETELQCLREAGGALESQLHCLKMVPLLFQFHIQIIDRGNSVAQKQSLAIDSLMNGHHSPGHRLLGHLQCHHFNIPLKDSMVGWGKGGIGDAICEVLKCIVVGHMVEGTSAPLQLFCSEAQSSSSRICRSQIDSCTLRKRRLPAQHPHAFGRNGLEDDATTEVMVVRMAESITKFTPTEVEISA